MRVIVPVQGIFLLIFQHFLFRIYNTDICILLQISDQLICPRFFRLFIIGRKMLFSVNRLLIRCNHQDKFTAPVGKPLLRCRKLRCDLCKLSFCKQICSLIIINVRFHAVKQPVIRTDHNLVVDGFFTKQL